MFVMVSIYLVQYVVMLVIIFLHFSVCCWRYEHCMWLQGESHFTFLGLKIQLCFKNYIVGYSGNFFLQRCLKLKVDLRRNILCNDNSDHSVAISGLSFSCKA